MKSGCNNGNVIHSNCVHCKSGFEGNCVEISDSNGLVDQCKGTYSYEKRGCYTMLKSMPIDSQFLFKLTQFLFQISDEIIHRGSVA